MKTYLKDLRWGKFNLIEHDMISRIATYYGEWSDVEVMIFHLLLNSQSNVVEVGANLGLHTVPIAKAVPQGKVFAFEPQRIIYQQLCCNLALNNLTNVYSYRLGVSDTNTQMLIDSCHYDTFWNYGSFSLDKGFSTEDDFAEPIQKEPIDIIKLDDFAPIARLDSLDLLKIDAEGFDVNVLNGAIDIITRLQPFVFVEYQPDTKQALLEFFAKHDYQVFWQASLRYQQLNYFQAPPIDTSGDINFLAIPNSRLHAQTNPKLQQLIQVLTPVQSGDELGEGKVMWLEREF